jgi:hypothetical protein
VSVVKSKRTVGVVHCGYVSSASSLPDTASSFSLSPDISKYRKVCKAEALEILTRLLHKDMAYNSEVMPVETARELSVSFIEGFDDASATFFTNIDFSGEGKKLGNDCWAGPNWNPVTDATFDAGIMAISPGRCGCLWIEDED